MTRTKFVQLSRSLVVADPAIASLVRDHGQYRSNTLGLVASECIASKAVREVMGSSLGDVYAEGAPGKRFYPSGRQVDDIEKLAAARTKSVFGFEYVNLQPHSGATANRCVYSSLLSPGDVLVTLKLDHGGHLTHGMAKNFSGTTYKIYHYEVDPVTGRLDMESVANIARVARIQNPGKKIMIVAGGSSYPYILDFESFGKIRDELNSDSGRVFLLTDMSHFAGLVAGNVYPSPVGVSDVVTFTTHKTLGGPRGAIIGSKAEYEAAINSGVFPGEIGGPFVHAIAARAVLMQEVGEPWFADYARNTIANAAALCDGLRRREITIFGEGTESHLFLVDLRTHGITGKEAQLALEGVGIRANRNVIPNDPQKPWITSGLRLGTPTLTRRGMGVDEMDIVAQCIADVLSNPNNPDVNFRVASKVLELCHDFPLYSE